MNPEVQEMIDALMAEVCTEEGVSPEQVFFLFCFSLAVVFIIIAILEKNLNKSDEDIKDRLWKLQGLHKKEKIFSIAHAALQF